MPTFPGISLSLPFASWNLPSAWSFVLDFMVFFRSRDHRRELGWKPNEPGVSCLSKFNAQYIERPCVFYLANMYKELWQGETLRRLWTCGGKALHATEALCFIDAACCTSSAEKGACNPRR